MTAEKIKAWKAFDKSMRCRGFQYEVGQTYEMDGEAVLCLRGFHACHENPLHVLRYYSINVARFAEVDQSGDMHKGEDKVASTSITIGAELSLGDLIELGASVAWEKAKGIYSATSGYSSTAVSSGYYSTAATSGDSSTAATSGYYSTAATSGDSSTAATSGDSSTAATSGGYSTAATSGDSSTAVSSGYYSTAKVTGRNSVAVSSGFNGMAAAREGSALVVCEYAADGTLTGVKAAIAGRDGVKPDTLYRLKDGELVEVDA